jgi:hypothetical protein
MNLKACPREKELRELVERGQWPQASAPELRGHVAACRSCSDLAVVSDAFKKARAATIAVARPGSAGALWWRAQLRRRNAAVERISRPLIGAQVFALAIVLLFGLGFAAYEAREGIAWLTWLQQLPQAASAHWQNLLASSSADPSVAWTLLLPAVAAVALFGGLAVYMAAERQ